ncbi:MAG: hypothetical protein WCI46_14340 [Verrucomicrobiota bacterium]|jgi:hypothetical protein
MPKRPNKTKVPKKSSDRATSSIDPNASGTVSDERRRQLATRATLGKFQGRKSI